MAHIGQARPIPSDDHIRGNVVSTLPDGDQAASSRALSQRHGEAIVPIFIGRGAPAYARARCGNPEVAVPASHLRSLATSCGYRHHARRSTCAACSSTTGADSPVCRCRCIWSDLSFANWRAVFSRALLMASSICLGVSSVMVLSFRSLPSEWHRAPQEAHPASVRR